MKFLKLYFSAAIFSLSFLYGEGQDFITVNREGNIYDQANAKYITENQDGEEINVMPGMVFKTSERTPGWYKIEYSPGLHAYIPEQITANGLKEPQPGSYKVANNPIEILEVHKNGEDWTALSGNTTFKGIVFNGIVVFNDNADNGKPKYSLVDLGSGPIVINYDNSLTKFF